MSDDDDDEDDELVEAEGFSDSRYIFELVLITVSFPVIISHSITYSLYVIHKLNVFVDERIARNLC